MSTLTMLCELGHLDRYEVDLADHEQPSRYLYAAPKVQGWFEDQLSEAPPDRSKDLTPVEQVEQLLWEFVTGAPLAYDLSVKKLNPLMQHVWELKTQDVRLIGWFPLRATFIICSGRLKSSLPRFRCYQPLIAEAIAIRDRLDLDSPKALTGTSRNDVL